MLCSAEPQDPREEAVSMEWWKELGVVVGQHRRGDETFLFCMDSNARVGSVISNSVGGAELDEESKNGELDGSPGYFQRWWRHLVRLCNV